LEKKKIFRWYKVRLNLPGSPEYDPELPWVSKVREDGNTMAADAFYFVDDARPTAPQRRRLGRQLGRLEAPSVGWGSRTLPGNAGTAHSDLALGLGMWLLLQEKECTCLFHRRNGTR
jgi:hypothetical protein